MIIFAVPRLKATHSQTTEGEVSRFLIQALTIIPGEDFQYKERNLTVRMLQIYSRFVQEGKIVEIAIGPWWPGGNRELDSIYLTASVKFCGIRVQPHPGIVTAAHSVFKKVDLHCLFSRELIAPSAKLTHQVQLLK